MQDSIDTIIKEIKNLKIDCPNCDHVEDPYYTCPVCWYTGGLGEINVFNFLKENKHLLDENHENNA